MRGLNWKIPFLSKETKTYETIYKKKKRITKHHLSFCLHLINRSSSFPSLPGILLQTEKPIPSQPLLFLPHNSSSFLFEKKFSSVFYIQNLYPHRKRFWSNFTLSDWEYMTITMAHAVWHTVLNTSGKQNKTKEITNKPGKKINPTQKTDNELIS